MNIKSILLCIGLFSYSYAVAQEDQLPLHLNYIGSSTVGNFIRDANTLLEATQFIIDTRPESTGGELAIIEGRADIAGTARIPSKDLLSSGVSSTLIGWDAIAIVVNKDNPVQNLTQSQLKAIYTGEVRNWKEFGGADLRIDPYIVGLESATRQVCRSIILGREDYQACEEVTPDSDIVERVKNNPGGLGHISYSFVKDDSSIKVLKINGQTLTLTNNNYPITRPLYLLWWSGRRDVAGFVNWTLSNEGQRVVMNRFIGIREAPVTMDEETGGLIVFTKTTPVEDGGIYYYPHDAYDILLPDRSLMMRVPNHLGRIDESPTRIELPVGGYMIRTHTASGEDLEFSVNVVAGKLTKLYPERKESLHEDFEIPSTSATLLNNRITESNSKSFELFGDFRVRAEQDYRPALNRFRGRFRIRAGMHARLSAQSRLEVRLVSTSDPNDPNSSHVNLDEGFNQINVAFDRAFFHYQSKQHSAVEWWLGKFSNPHLSSQVYSEVLWDDDIQPEGTAFSLKAPGIRKAGNVKFTNGFYLLSQFRSGTRKNWLYSGQLSSVIELSDHWSLTLASELFYFVNIKGLDVSSSFLDRNEGNQTYLQTIIQPQDTIITTHYTSDFHILDNFLNVKTTALPYPMTFKIQWIHNFGADTRNNGFSAGVSYGQLADKHDWLIFYQFNYLEQESVFTPYAQDDTPRRTNTAGHVVGIAYSLHKKISLQLGGLFDNPMGDSRLESRIRLDLNLKF